MSYEYRWALLHPALLPLGIKCHAFPHGPFWVLNYVLVAIGYTIKPWKFLKSWASKLLRLPNWKIEMSKVIESSHSLAGPSKRHMSTHGHYRDTIVSTRMLFFVIAEVLAASTLEFRRRAASFIQAIVRWIGIGVFENEVIRPRPYPRNQLFFRWGFAVRSHMGSCGPKIPRHRQQSLNNGY